ARHQRQQPEARAGRAGAVDQLEVERDEHNGAEHRHPIVKPIALATLKTRERKSESGRIGSAARVSHQTKRISRATPTIPSPTIAAEPQAYSLPPHVVSRISALTPALRRSAPSTSIRCLTVGVCRCSRVATIRTASAPTGM